MRFSLGSVGDVEVTPGAALAECRPAIDALLGPSAGAELWVAGRVLAPDQVAGVPPWQAGCHVAVGPPTWQGGASGGGVGASSAVGGGGAVGGGEATDPEAAARARWHVAVVGGPDAGAVAALEPGGRLLIGRGIGRGLGRDIGRGVGAGDRLPLTDVAVSRDHLRLIARRGVLVRECGSTNRTWRQRPSRRAWGRVDRRAPRWRRVRRTARLRPGDRLRIGTTELELRTGPGRPGDGPGAVTGAEPWVADRGLMGPEPPVARPGAPAGVSARQAEPGALAGRIAAAVVPLLLAATMAALTRSPVFLLMAAAGPLAAAAPALSARLARRRPARQGCPGPDLGADAAAVSVLLAGGATTAPAWWSLAREGLVVRGDDAACTAAGRALVGGALLDPRVTWTLLRDGARAGDWRWARWSVRLRADERTSLDATGGRTPGTDGPRRLVVADGGGPWRTDLDRWWLAAASAGPGETADAAVVVLARGDEPAPAWCRWLLRICADGRARLTGPGIARDVPAPVASAAWAEAHARRLAARDTTPSAVARRVAGLGRDGRTAGPPAEPGADLPLRVGPADVGLPGDVDGVLDAWGGHDVGRRALPGLRVPIGMAAGPHGVRPAWLDLTTDGPHALVAGTTGAGKSELLQALVLGLALRHPPAELALVLLDFKGGAGLRTCAGLPHVVGSVSDLDPDQAVRALEGLAAELKRREALLAAAGVSDLEQLRAPGRGRGTGGGPARPAAPPAVPPVVPPRLLVVVDEFRALAEELPDFVPGLVRLAAQGRSLGMHLVLATQRPGGAVTAQMRTNLALRICLRVTEPAESHDVVDSPDAAAIPSRAPGRAVVRRADGVGQVVQTVWAALPARRRELVRPARPWEAFGRPWPDADPGADGGSGAQVPTAAPDPDAADALAGRARAAAARLGLPAPTPLWSPPLPATVDARELADAVDPGRPAGAGCLTLGVTDPPGAGRRGVLAWDGRGLLLVTGASGSGRTTAAARAGAEALGAGRHVHAVGPVARELPAAHRGLGTTVDGTDPRRLTRLLTVLTEAGRPHGPGGEVVLVDDVAAVTAALDRMPRGAGAGLLERLAREAGPCGIGLLVTGHPRDVSRLAPLAAARIVLPVADPGDDALLGVPRELGGRRLPGRGVLVTGGEAVRCHVALPGPTDEAGGPPDRPLLLRPIPHRVTRAALSPARHTAQHPDQHPDLPTARRTSSSVEASSEPAWVAAVGAGGDDAGAVTLDARRGVLVVGPAGSGRSTALATLVGSLATAGIRVGVVAHDGPLAHAARELGLPHADGPGAAVTLADHAATGRERLQAFAVDDLDALASVAEELDDRLAAWARAAEHGGAAPAVLAACRTDRAASAYRGAVAVLRGLAPLLVLSPAEAGSAEVAGCDLSRVDDPALPRHPGRGAVVVRGRATPVQVAV